MSKESAIADELDDIDELDELSDLNEIAKMVLAVIKGFGSLHFCVFVCRFAIS